MMNKYSVVEVEWLDAQTGFNIAEPIEELIKYHEPIITYSVGYLIYECDEYIILGFMLFGDEMIKHNQLIPKGMIRSRLTIREEMKNG